MQEVTSALKGRERERGIDVYRSSNNFSVVISLSVKMAELKTESHHSYVHGQWEELLLLLLFP